MESATITARHYIGNEAAYDEFESKTDLLLESVPLKRYVDRPDRMFFVRASVPSTLPRYLRNWIDSKGELLWKRGFRFLERVDSPVGEGFREALFGTGEIQLADVNVLGCIDQYDYTTDEALERIDYLIRSLFNGGFIYGLGASDKPIILNPVRKASEVRVIHELFNSVFMRPVPLYNPDRVKAAVTEGYKRLGASSSGLYLVNHSHDKADELRKKELEFFGNDREFCFGGEYYAGLKASRLGKVGTAYVAGYTNRYYGETENESPEETAAVKAVEENIIARATRKIAATDVGPEYRAVIMLANTVNEISKFYPRELVLEVQRVMLDCF